MTAATEFRAPSRPLEGRNPAAGGAVPFPPPDRHLEDSSKPVRPICGVERDGGLRCKMRPLRGYERCGWHRTRTPPPPPKQKPQATRKPPQTALLMDRTDRRLLGPLLSRLRLWAREYDDIGAEAGEPLTTSAAFCSWLALELAPQTSRRRVLSRSGDP